MTLPVLIQNAVYTCCVYESIMEQPQPSNRSYGPAWNHALVNLSTCLGHRVYLQEQPSGKHTRFRGIRWSPSMYPLLYHLRSVDRTPLSVRLPCISFKTADRSSPQQTLMQTIS